MDLKLYTPHDNQRPIHASPARNKVAICGRRFGKSALLLNEAISLALQVPKQIAWIILPLYRQAKEIYWIDPDITQYFMPYVNAGICKADKSELSLYFKHTDSWVRLKGSDNYDSLRGSGLDFIGWDETDDIKPEAFDVIEPALADSPNHRQMYVGTPKGLGKLHDLALRGSHKIQIPDFGKKYTKDPDYESWHFTSLDNRTWPEGSKERTSFVRYIAERRVEAEEKGKLAWFNQEYMASFEQSSGRFFPTWSYDTHTIQTSMRAYPGAQVIETIDWGISNPFCWLAHLVVKEKYAGINFNRVYTFAELYGVGKTPSEWAKDIIRKREQYGILTDSVSKIYVDNTMFSVVLDGSLSIVKQFNQSFSQQEGKTYTFERGSKNRKARWSSMMDWMRLAPDGKPYWIITKDVPNLSRTLPLMEPDELDIEDMNSKLEDHACFCRHTPILTKQGYKPIIEVTTKDKVWTPIGWSKVLKNIQTGKNSVNTFRSMKVTANHPFLTQDGFRPLRDLKATDKLWNVYIFSENRIEDTLIQQTFQIKHILGVVQRRNEKLTKSYTAMYGDSLRGIFLKAFTFTIRVATTIATILKILRWSILPTTLRSIYLRLERLLKNEVLLDKKKRGYSIEAQRDINYTYELENWRGRINLWLLKIVNFVKKITKPISPHFQGSAVTHMECQCGDETITYNLETDTGMYTAGDVLVSNCDSSSFGLNYIPWIDAKAETGDRGGAIVAERTSINEDLDIFSDN